MEPTYLFLDCEWADVLGADLVSMALISADGRHQFYAERDPLPALPTDFARVVVYPLLDRREAALSDAEFTYKLRQFFFGLVSPRVIFDDHNDGALLRFALAGFDLPDPDDNTYGPTPSHVRLKQVQKGLLSTFVEDWFRAHMDADARRHNAMVDANALRYAWIAANCLSKLG